MQTDHLEIENVENSNDFFQIMDLLKEEYDQTGEDKDGFYNNRSRILDSYMKQQMFIIYDRSLDNAYYEFEHLTPGNVKNKIGFSCAPAFCTFNEKDEMDIIWVHKDWRNRGYARLFIEEFRVPFVFSTKTAIPFWEHMGFQNTGTAENDWDTTVLMKHES